MSTWLPAEALLPAAPPPGLSQRTEPWMGDLWYLTGQACLLAGGHLHLPPRPPGALGKGSSLVFLGS